MSLIFCRLLMATLALQAIKIELSWADDAKVLPHGRWRLRLLTAYSESDSKYNSDGNISSLGSPFSRNIDVKLARALDPKPQFEEYIQKRNTLSPGSGDSFLAEPIAFMDTKIESSLIANTLVAEYGLSDKLSLGIILPIIYGRTEVSASSSTDAAYEEKLKSVENLPEAHPERLFRKKLKESTTISSINSLLNEKYGYSQALSSWSGAGLGDLEMGAKYNYLKRHPLRATGKLGFRAPTGREDDPDLLMDFAFGDGQWDLGFFHLVDIDLLSNLSLTWESGYTYQIASDLDLRIPLSTDLPIAASTTSLERKLGDYWETGIEANLNPIKELTLSTKYRFRQKFEDEYSGPANIDFSILISDTQSILHEVNFQIEYTNLPSVQEGRAPIPYAVGAYYKTALAGENQNDFRIAGIQLKTYF